MSPPFQNGPRLSFGNNEPIKKWENTALSVPISYLLLMHAVRGGRKVLIPLVASRTQLILVSWERQKGGGKEEKRELWLVCLFHIYSIYTHINPHKSLHSYSLLTSTYWNVMTSVTECDWMHSVWKCLVSAVWHGEIFGQHLIQLKRVDSPVLLFPF